MPLKLEFQKIWSDYGKLLHLHTDKPCNQAWSNQCAIRMSIILEESGVNFSHYADPKCKHGHPRGAESLANWIWKQHKPPLIYSDVKTGKSKLATHTGIVFFKNCFTRNGELTQSGDHIDLWNKGATRTYGDDLNKSEQLWFWSFS